MIRTDQDAYDAGFCAALQTRSRIAREARCRAAAAEGAARLYRRALFASGIVTAVLAAIVWWLILWRLAPK